MPFDLREHLDPGATVSLERSEEEGLGEPWQETIQSLAHKAAWTPPPQTQSGGGRTILGMSASCCVHTPGGEESSQLDVPSCTRQRQAGLCLAHLVVPCHQQKCESTAKWA